MPIALDPNETVDIILSLEKKKVNPPIFISKYMTCRENTKYSKLIKQAVEEKDDEKGLSILIEAFSIVLKDWKNINKDFNLNDIPDILTASEIWELASLIPKETSLSEHDKKKLFWQQELDGEKAVNTIKEPANV